MESLLEEHNSDPPRLVVITGPTASGKTQIVIEVAKSLNAEIINADSVQVYRGFNIGSAKPSSLELSQIPHHLISCIEPEEEFNAGIFCHQAKAIIDDISKRGKLPLIVGGTGLYIRSLLCGLAPVPKVTAEAIAIFSAREQELRVRHIEKPLVVKMLYQWLEELDPATAARLFESDYSRIRRALLVFLSSGKSLIDLQASHAHSTSRFSALVIVLEPERSLLYERINSRVEEMVEQGLIDEVKKLSAKHNCALRAFNSLGYRQVLEYLSNSIKLEELKLQIKQETRRFAKRQITWWRNQPQALGWKKVDYLIDLSDTFSENQAQQVARQLCSRVLNIIKIIELWQKHQRPEAEISYLNLKVHGR